MDRVAFFQQRQKLYQKNPVLFFNEVLQFEPDDWQIAVAMDLAEHPLVTVRSGQGVGKTALEAATLLWFLTCFPFPRVVATAPTRQQLHDVLWSEVAKWQAKSPLLSELLKWTKTYIYMVGMEKRWFAVARTATKPENMQGFHEENMLFIVDEASGVADQIMEAILGTLSGPNNKLLLCGNPTKTSGTFADSHSRDRALYKCHKVSSLDSPRTNKENIKALIRKYGVDSNFVIVRILGDFPKQEDDVFLPLSLVEAAITNDLCYEEDLQGADIPFINIGCDVARYGSDETVLAENVGNIAKIDSFYCGQSLMVTCGNVISLYRSLLKRYPRYRGNIHAMIDDCGLGGGVTDRLRELKVEMHINRLIIVPVNAAGAVPDKQAAKEYENLTTYMYSIVRDLLSDQALRIIDDADMIAQLSVRKYRMTSRGKIALESKDEMKKRGISSPDRADAVALSCYKGSVFDVSSLIT